MPDFFNTHAMENAPRGWSEAFAALPIETPPSDGWARISRALEASAPRQGALRRERRTTWLIGLASAAVLVLAAWSPLSRWLQSSGQSQPPVIASETPGLRGPAAPVRSEPLETRETAPSPASDVHPSPTNTASTATQPTHRKPSRRTPAVARRSADSDLATVSQTIATQKEATPGNGAITTAADANPLPKLQAQSAQLEALVALARDDRVANASELLSSELDAGIAAVDAALSQPDVSDTRRQELWQQRVDLLRQLAGVEATSRWLAAQGASNDTTLVSVD